MQSTGLSSSTWAFPDCRQRAPNLLYHVRFEIGTFWLAFSCFCAYGVRYAWEKYEKNQKKKEMANLKSKSVEDNLDAGDDGDAKASTKPKSLKVAIRMRNQRKVI